MTANVSFFGPVPSMVRSPFHHRPSYLTPPLSFPSLPFSSLLYATPVGQYRGAASLPDVVLGLLFCLSFSVTLTDGIKLMVGRPRPNYAALRALVEFGGESAASFKVWPGAI